jgi:hypothetical protein
MRKLIALGTLLTITLIAPIASAQTPATPHHPTQPARMMHSFQQRIRQGVRSGSLTPTELRALRTRMSSLRTEMTQLRNAGVPPPPEQRRHLRQQLRQTNRAIYLAKHNR